MVECHQPPPPPPPHHHPWSTNLPSRPDNNSTHRQIKQRLGGSAEWPNTYGNYMVSREGSSAHKLPRAASSLSGNESVWEGVAEYHSPTTNGHYSSELHQSQRGHRLTTTLSASTDNLDLVCQEEHSPPSMSTCQVS